MTWFVRNAIMVAIPNHPHSFVDCFNGTDLLVESVFVAIYNDDKSIIWIVVIEWESIVLLATDFL